MKIVLMETIHHNSEWEKFLDVLENQYQKDIAGATMDWIKGFLREKHPDAVSALNGELIAEITKQE